MCSRYQFTHIPGYTQCRCISSKLEIPHTILNVKFMDGLGGKATRTDFDVKPENIKVNVSSNVSKHILRNAHDITRSGKIL